MLSLLAPAKVNLSFEVTGNRHDGYHEVTTVLQAIGLYDEISFEVADDLQLVTESSTSVIRSEDNMVIRSAEALREATRITKGAHITLKKRIPVAAGLGGGSSDAATTLLGLCRLWNLTLSDNEIYRIASRLGADVAFFIRGGTAIGRGRGDALEMLPQPIERFVVLKALTEDSPGFKTRNMFGMLTMTDYTDGTRADMVAQRIRNDEAVATLMYNTFESLAVAAYPYYDDARRIFDGCTDHALLAGSGPSLFALVDNLGMAEQLVACLGREGMNASIARLLGPWTEDGLSVEN